MKTMFWPDTMAEFAHEHAFKYRQLVGEFFMELLDGNQPKVAEMLRDSFTLNPTYSTRISVQVIDFCWEHWDLDLMCDTEEELLQSMP